MKLVFLGTPQMAVPPLRALAERHAVQLVVTRVDKRRGRGGQLVPSPVKAAARELGIPVSHDPDDVLQAAADGAELGVVVAYGRIIKPHQLAALPMVNLHFSLLPRWRGAAPVERALLAGDDVTGVCVMAVEEGLDTGGVYARAEVPIGVDTTAASLRDELVRVGADLLVGVLAQPIADWIDDSQPQVGQVTYAAKIEKSELEIDWSQDPAAIDRLVRLGGAWTMFRGKRLKIIAAHVADARLVLDVVQPEGKKPMPFHAWRHGAQPAATELFGDLA